MLCESLGKRQHNSCTDYSELMHSSHCFMYHYKTSTHLNTYVVKSKSKICWFILIYGSLFLLFFTIYCFFQSLVNIFRFSAFNASVTQPTLSCWIILDLSITSQENAHCEIKSVVSITKGQELIYDDKLETFQSVFDNTLFVDLITVCRPFFINKRGKRACYSYLNVLIWH